MELNMRQQKITINELLKNRFLEENIDYYTDCLNEDPIFAEDIDLLWAEARCSFVLYDDQEEYVQKYVDKMYSDYQIDKKNWEKELEIAEKKLNGFTEIQKEVMRILNRLDYDTRELFVNLPLELKNIELTDEALKNIIMDVEQMMASTGNPKDIKKANKKFFSKCKKAICKQMRNQKKTINCFKLYRRVISFVKY